MNRTGAQLWRWYFAEGDGRSIAALRIGFGLYSIWHLIDLYPVLDLLYGKRGLYGSMIANVGPLEGISNLLWRYDDPQSLRVFFAAALIASILMTVGAASRMSVALVFFAHLLLSHRNPYTMYGADGVFRHMMLWMLFARTGAVASVDGWLRAKLRRGRDEVGVIARPVPLWPMRGMQLQLALVYLFTGYFKLKTDLWADGSAVYYAVQGVGLQTSMTPTLLAHRWAIMPLTYGALVFELAFALGVFTSYRYLVLLGGVFLHLGIDLFMMIPLFSAAMFVSYLAFVEEEHWTMIVQTTRTLLNRLQVPERLQTSAVKA